MEEDVHSCCVCADECGGGHKCDKCRKALHPFCGEGEEEDEGYGGRIICHNCLPIGSIRGDAGELFSLIFIHVVKFFIYKFNDDPQG